MELPELPLQGLTKDKHRMQKLMEKEAILKEKKKKISQDEEGLSDKLSKIEKIKSELNDV